MAPVTRPILVDEDFGNRHDDDGDGDGDHDGEGDKDDSDGGDDDCDEFKALHYFSLLCAHSSSFQK